MKIESSYTIGIGKQNIGWVVVLMVLVLCGIAAACFNPQPPCTEPCTSWNGFGCVNYCNLISPLYAIANRSIGTYHSSPPITGITR